MHPETAEQSGFTRRRLKRATKQCALAYALMLPLAWISLSGLPAAASSEIEEVTNLEMRFFAHDYAGQSLSERIERLEKMTFGESKSGPLKTRVSQLLSAVPAPDKKPEPTSRTQTERTQTESAPTENSSATPTEKATASPQDSSDYPTVTKLENMILGKAYREEILAARLDRLETKAFGSSSNTSDFSRRVDRLKSYAGLSYHDVEEDGGIELTSSSQDSGGAIPQSGLVTSIGQLENDVFARTYSSKPLATRLRALEMAIFPGAPAPAMSMLERVGKLRAAVMQERAMANMDAGAVEPVLTVPPPAYNTGYQSMLPPAYNTGAQGMPPTTASTDPLPPPTRSSGKHPFMHALAKALTVAGQMAVGALSNGVYLNGASVPVGSFGFPGFGPSPFGFGGAPMFINGRWY